MLNFAAVMVVLFGGLALLLQTEFSDSLDQGLNRSLGARAAELATLLNARRRLPALPEVDGAFAQIVAVRGRVLDATTGFGAPLLTAPELRRASAATVTLDHGDRARLLAQPISTRPGAVLVVGASLSQLDHAMTSLNELLFIGGPLLLLITCLAGYVLAERALAPVQRMAAWAERISGAPGDDRLPLPEAKDELRELGDALNAVLDRLGDALRRERKFVAYAGHELRTPISILKLELELARASGGSGEDLDRRLRSAGEEVDRLAQLARDLLVLGQAELGQLQLRCRAVRVRELLEIVAERFAAAYGLRSDRVRTLDEEGLVLDADPARLERALANMVSNALRHGAGDVVLVARRGEDALELHVLDEGPGFAPDFIPHAFECFTREETGHRGTGGVGLGLSIVAAIAEAHGGHAQAVNRPGGGADVWLSLPLSRASVQQAPSPRTPLAAGA